MGAKKAGAMADELVVVRGDGKGETWAVSSAASSEDVSEDVSGAETVSTRAGV